VTSPRKARLSLHPLTVEEALADLLRVKPEGHKKKSSQKPKAARKGPKKKARQRKK